MEHVNKEKLSAEAQAFVDNLQKIQDNFADYIAGQVMFIDKEGRLITEPTNSQRVCQEYIQKADLGQKGCQHLVDAVAKLLTFREKPLRMKCPAGYLAFWIPIKLKGEVVGAVAACGGLLEEGKSEEEYEKNFTRLAELFNITTNEDYFEAATKEPERLTEESLDQKTNKITSLLETLSEERAFEEIFKGEEATIE